MYDEIDLAISPSEYQMHCDAMGVNEKKSSQPTCDKQLILKKHVFEMDMF